MLIHQTIHIGASPGWVCVSRLKAALGWNNYFLSSLLLTWLSFLSNTERTGSRSFPSPWQCRTALSEPRCGEALSQLPTLTAAGHSITSATLTFSSDRAVLCVVSQWPLAQHHRAENKVQISYLEIFRGLGCRNLTRSLITKREAFESARPAPHIN